MSCYRAGDKFPNPQNECSTLEPCYRASTKREHAHETLNAIIIRATSRGFLHATGPAAEHASPIAYMHDDDTECEAPGVSDYGTLA